MADPIGGMQAVASFFDKWINYSQARAMQEDMNEYNSPKNQVARLRAAGLSPWSVNPGINQAAQPVFGESKLAESFGAVADRRMMNRQLDIQENLAKAETAEKISNAEVNRTLAATNNILLKYLPESEQQRIRGLIAQATESEKRVSRYDEEVNQNIATQKSVEIMNYVNSGKALADTNRINRLVEYEVKEAASRIKVNENQVAYLKSMCKLNNQQVAQVIALISKTQKEAEKIGAEAWLEKYKNKITQRSGIRPGTPPWTSLSDAISKILSERAEMIDSVESGNLRRPWEYNGSGSW